MFNKVNTTPSINDTVACEKLFKSQEHDSRNGELLYKCRSGKLLILKNVRKKSHILVWYCATAHVEKINFILAYVNAYIMHI